MTTEPFEPPLPKLDPEAMVLRVRPPRIARVRRGVVIGLAALGSTALIGVTVLALHPVHKPLILVGEGAPVTEQSAAPDVLANVPSTYADVPSLDPRRGSGQDLSTGSSPQASAPGAMPQSSTRDMATDQTRQRQQAAREAALISAVLVQHAQASGTVTAQTAESGAVQPPLLDDGPRLGLDPDHDPNGEQHKVDLVDRRETRADVNPHDLQPAASPWILSAGSVIAANLMTGLDSDLPGQVAAQISENVYDSPTGRVLLIPQGSRLVGKSDNVVAYGQRRALVVWQRIILPDGSSLQIDNLPATDAAGYVGLTDTVDAHGWALLKGVLLSTVLGVGTELSFGSSDSDLVRALRESSQGGADRATQQITSKTLNIQPTIRVRPGWPVRVVVHSDIVLRPWKD